MVTVSSLHASDLKRERWNLQFCSIQYTKYLCWYNNAIVSNIISLEFIYLHSDIHESCSGKNSFMLESKIQSLLLFGQYHSVLPQRRSSLMQLFCDSSFFLLPLHSLLSLPVLLLLLTRIACISSSPSSSLNCPYFCCNFHPDPLDPFCEETDNTGGWDHVRNSILLPLLASYLFSSALTWVPPYAAVSLGMSPPLHGLPKSCSPSRVFLPWHVLPQQLSPQSRGTPYLL